jgi:CBS domain-containing protein
MRPFLLGEGPLFPVTPHAILGLPTMFSATGVGLVGGLIALLLTIAVYASEDLFHRLPIHWMWWPAIGGVFIGVGGYLQPRALGVGYDIISDLLSGNYVLMSLLFLVIVKAFIWATSLGSGTSGGVLAPLLIIGGSVGALLSPVLPGGDAALWPLVCMAAVLGGTMRSPLTGAIFALELTHDMNALPALLIASVVAYGFTVLIMKRSILTEKVARRGYHVSREYAVDPLELTSVKEVMSSPVVMVPASLPVMNLVTDYFLGREKRKHQGYPVVDASGLLLGFVTRSDMLQAGGARLTVNGEVNGDHNQLTAGDLVHRTPVTALPWESCRTAAERMAETGVGRIAVVSPDDGGKVVGIVTRSDLLKPRGDTVEQESKREKFIRLRAKKSGLVKRIAASPSANGH